MSHSKKNILRLSLVLLFALLAGCASLESRHFGIQFIDSETGRGVPLVEIESTNSIQFVSDSAGWVAISPLDLAGDSFYFTVHSHGYELKEDQRGFRGISIKPLAGKNITVELQRTNIAERLYRITGEGIYHDSQLLGIADRKVLPNKANGGVFGQDSAVNVIYDDQLYWFWGDTKRADGPLGNFKVAGATSSLHLSEDNNPADGIDLNYFVDTQGFTRQMCPIEGDGMVWISGLMVFEEDGREQMFTHYSRWENVETRLEQGIAAWNKEEGIFEREVEFPLDSPLSPRGNPIKLKREGQTWFYFGYNFPDIRVRATRQDILNPKRYQAYTCLIQGSRWQYDSPPLERDKNGQLVCGWKEDTDTITEKRWDHLYTQGLVKRDEKDTRIIDIETGEQISVHAGHVAWNEHRNRWIAIFNQFYGDSVLGEVWYAEALSPMGPWSEARKIVSHDRYSFYNVKQHPYFANGPYLYFEGTYTKSFSGNTHATPRYDYNQIMYRLNLDDPRLPQIGE